jgi:hypothetical protein
LKIKKQSSISALSGKTSPPKIARKTTEKINQRKDKKQP